MTCLLILVIVGTSKDPTMLEVRMNVNFRIVTVILINLTTVTKRVGSEWVCEDTIVCNSRRLMCKCIRGWMWTFFYTIKKKVNIENRHQNLVNFRINLCP